MKEDIQKVKYAGKRMYCKEKAVSKLRKNILKRKHIRGKKQWAGWKINLQKNVISQNKLNFSVATVVNTQSSQSALVIQLLIYYRCLTFIGLHLLLKPEF